MNLTAQQMEGYIKARMEHDAYIVNSVPKAGMGCSRCGKHMAYRLAVKQWRDNYRSTCPECETALRMQEGSFYDHR